MQITLCKDPFEYIIIDDTYTEEELKLIFLELEFWTLSKNLMNPKHTGTATWNDGTPKKQNKGIFLDHAYIERQHSNILKLNRKIYEIELTEPSIIFNFLKTSNYDNTLISYYENNNHYKSHKDASVLTALTYLYKQPKSFEGGDLLLTQYDIAFEPWFNRTYIIFGAIEHEVTQVFMSADKLDKGLGRYCISNFIHKEINK